MSDGARPPPLHSRSTAWLSRKFSSASLRKSASRSSLKPSSSSLQRSSSLFSTHKPPKYPSSSPSATSLNDVDTRGGDTPEDGDDYVNPLEQGSRWLLSARAYALRQAAHLGFSLMNFSALAPTSVVWLDSTLGNFTGKAKIKVEIWEPAPPGPPKAKEGKSKEARAKDPKSKEPAAREPPAAATATAAPTERRTGFINFHGGGFVVGQGSDDAFWAGAVVKGLDAVVFSVNYRLAPEFPFPNPVEDCADAIMQIAARASEFGVDPDRIFISGFSAGGSLSLASWVLLQTPLRWGYQLAHVKPPRIAGFVLFYPLLDYTISRPRKRTGCVKPDLTLPKNMTDLFDASYLYPKLPKEDRDDPRLSPGLMADEQLVALPPVHLCICEYDMLLAEGHSFADRLKDAGKDITVRVVERAKHAWDKPPPMWPKESVHVEYGHAQDSVRRWVSGDSSGADDSGEAGEDDGPKGPTANGEKDPTGPTANGDNGPKGPAANGDKDAEVPTIKVDEA